MTAVIPAPAHSPDAVDDRTLHLGPDSQGVELEILTVPSTTGVIIIHAMLMHKRYRPLLHPIH